MIPTPFSFDHVPAHAIAVARDLDAGPLTRPWPVLRAFVGVGLQEPAAGSSHRVETDHEDLVGVEMSIAGLVLSRAMIFAMVHWVMVSALVGMLTCSSV